MNQQATLGDVTPEGVERPAVESRTADEHQPGHETVLFGEASPRLTPEGHDWLGTRPVYCLDCGDVVERRPV